MQVADKVTKQPRHNMIRPAFFSPLENSINNIKLSDCPFFSAIVHLHYENRTNSDTDGVLDHPCFETQLYTFVPVVRTCTGTRK